MIPFLKRCGGKSKLVSKLMKDLPEFKVYHEPFLGGGALFCALQVQQAYLSDIEPGLISAWKQVQEDSRALISLIETYPLTKEFFFQLQAVEPKTLLEEAARFLYLNKTCFNGVMPYNKEGRLNLSWGGEGKQKSCLFVAENLEELEGYLRHCTIECQSWEVAISKAKEKDLVFLDPPYLDSSDIYTHEDFDFQQQRQLSIAFDDLVNRGVYVMLTNKACSTMHAFYRKYNREEVPVTVHVKEGIQHDLVIRSW